MAFFSLAAENLIDEAIGISVALEGAIPYETAFNSTPFERGRMKKMIEKRNNQ